MNLKDDVREWNQWKNKNKDIEIDLNNADLSNTRLRHVNLSNTNLRNANLSYANLSYANLRNANLSYANLSYANLSNANLSYANLSYANLSYANLSYANLSNANLRNANLKNANLSNANLRNANLSYANLSNANLSNANLNDANLIVTQAIYTNFEGAILTGACILDWHINSKTELNNVICDYIYFDYDYEKDRATDCYPCNPDQNFELGKFSQLIQNIYETIHLIFKTEINYPQELEETEATLEQTEIRLEETEAILEQTEAILQETETTLKLRLEETEAILEDTKDTLEDKENTLKKTEDILKETAIKQKQIELKYKKDLSEANVRHHKKIEDMEKDHEHTLKLECEKARREVLEKTNTDIMESQRPNLSVQAVSTSNNDQPHNISLNSIYDSNLRDSMVNGIITGNAKVSHSTNEAQDPTVREIEDLIEELKKNNPTATTTEQMAVATEAIERIESNPTLKKRAINAAIGGLMGAIKETFIGSTIVGAIESWINTPQMPKD